MRGYHVTQQVAVDFAMGKPNLIAREYPDRHNEFPGEYRNWGVWNYQEMYWVYVDDQAEILDDEEEAIREPEERYRDED